MNYLNLVRNFFSFKRNTKKSKSEIEKIQDKKLRELLIHAFDNSKYYRKSFEDAGIERDEIYIRSIGDFPIIDKAKLMEHFDEIVTVEGISQEELRKFDENDSKEEKMFKNKYHLVHSSGSTGKPCFFLYDDKAWNEMLLGIIRAALWDMTNIEVLKLLIKKPKIVYMAATDGRYGGAMAVGSGIEGLKMEQLFLDIKMPITEWIAEIERFKPNIIIGYPSAIKILAELVEKGSVLVEIMRVISCGEPLGKSLRQYMKKVFKADIINIYGASESLALGVESGNSNGMYLFDDMNYIEMENGIMYLTSLYNKVQPLIRYRISDKLDIVDGNGSDNYPFTKVKSIVGRNEDLIWFEDEEGTRDFLHPLAIEGFCVEGLVDYQFKQISINEFEMIAEAPNKKMHSFVNAEMKRNMKEILKEKKLDYVKFKISFTDYIEANKSTGKKQLILK